MSIAEKQNPIETNKQEVGRGLPDRQTNTNRDNGRATVHSRRYRSRLTSVAGPQKSVIRHLTCLVIESTVTVTYNQRF